MGNDLIQIGINVESNANQATAGLDGLTKQIVQTNKTSQMLEKQYKELDRAFNTGKISAQTYAKTVQSVDRSMDRLYSSLNDATNGINRTSKAMVQSTVAAKSASAAMNQYGKVSALGGKKMNRTNMIIQQSGYQFQDFAVQIQGGTNAFVALGQQGSQLLGVFGPAGAVLGAFLAVGTAIARMKTDGSNLSFNFKKFGEDIGKSLEPVKPILSAIGSVFAAVGKAMGTAANFIVQNLSRIITVALTAATVYGTVFAAGVLKAVLSVKTLSKALEVLKANLVKTGVGALVVAAGLLIHEFMRLVSAVGSVGKAFNMVWSVAKEIFGRFVPMVKRSYYNMLMIAEDFNLAVYIGLKDLVDNYGESFNKIGAVVKGVFAGVKAVFFALPKAAFEAAKQLADLFISGIQFLLDGAVAATNEIIVAFDKMGNFTKGLVAGVVAVFKKMPTAIGNVAKSAANLFVDGMELLANGALGAINKVMGGFNKIANFFGADKARAFFGFEGDILKPFKDVDLKEYKSEIEDAGVTLGETFKASFEEASASSGDPTLVEWYNLDGLRPQLSEAGVDLADTFTTAYNEAFGESISNKPLLDYLNKAIIESGGLINSYETLQKAAETAFKAPMPELKKLMEAIGKGEKSVDDLATYFTLVEKESEEAAKGAKELADTLNKPLLDAIGSVSNAFGDFIANGLKDFKGFAASIVDSFKSMISQMISTAMKNRIMISLGMGGAGFASGAGAAGTSAAFGGSAGGMMGTLGSGAAMASGSGMTGFMGSMAGGTGAMGAVGNFASGGYSALTGTTVATGAAGTTAAALGAVVAPLLAVAAIISFFKKKVKELDSGLQGTVTTLDATIESFSKIKTTKFWGLSKKVSTSSEELSEEEASPFVKAVQEIQMSVMDAAEQFGIAGDVFDDFSYDFKLSLKGLSEEAKSAAIAEEFTKMGDAFASMSGLFENMNDLMTVYQQRLDLEKQLLTAQGAIVELRKQELDAVHVLNRGLAARLQLMQAEGGLQSALTAFASGISQQQGLIRRAVDALVKPLQDAIDRTRSQAEKSYSIFKAAADKSVGSAQDIVDIITGALDSRTIVSESAELMRYQTAQKQLASFAGGADFDKASLTRATEGVSIDSTKFFGSFEDYARDFYKTQISLTKLADKAEGELTDVEKQIDIADKAYQVAMGTYQETQDFNVALNNLLNDLAAYTEVAARNEPFIEQIKAEGDRQVDLLESILVETTKQVNGLLGVENSIADLVGTNVSVGEALSVLGLEGGELAGAVFALEPTVAAIGSHIEDLDLTLSGTIDSLGLSLQDIVELDLTAGFENLDLFAPLANIDFGKQLQPVVDIVNTLQELDLSGPIAEQLALLSELDFVGDLEGPLSGLTTEVSALDTATSGLNLGVVGLDGTIGILSSSVDTEANNILTLNGTVINQTVSVDALTGQVTSLTGNVFNLDGTVLGFGTKVSELGVSNDNLGINITDLGTTLTDAMSGLGSIVSGLSGAVSGLAASNNALASAQKAVVTAEKVSTITTEAAAIVAALEAIDIPDVVEVVASKYKSGFFGDKASTATLSTGDMFSTKAGSGDQERLNAVALAQTAADKMNLENQAAPLAEQAALEADLEAKRQQIADLGGTAAFASGGMHSGGMRLVGENGPELEATGPSRIYSAQQTKSLMSGGSGEVVQELRSLRREVSELKAEQRKVGVENVKYNKKSYDLYREWDTVGLPATRTA